MKDREEKRRKKWWYDLGVFVILAVLFLGIDYLSDGRIDWAQWPIFGLAIFYVGFTFLNKYGRE